MNQRGKKKEYCILKDPHLIYHLQSPVKISHLLSSGLYELEENKIIEIETMQGLQISNFVMKQLPEELKEKYSKKRWIQEQNDKEEEQGRKMEDSVKKRRKYCNQEELIYLHQIKGLNKFWKKIL